MTLNKLTPIMIVDHIEPELPFWDRLGFERIAEVPHEGGLGFALLNDGSVDVMLQSKASVEDDLALEMEGSPRPSCVLYIDVAELEPVMESLADFDVVVEERTTFYGKREVFYRSPGGAVVGFSASVVADEDS